MKKSHFLQTLYLQKPLFLILLIATLSTLPWIGLGDFYTKGEPREAALAVSMIEKGEWLFLPVMQMNLHINRHLIIGL